MYYLLLLLFVVMYCMRKRYAVIVSLVRKPIDFKHWLDHHFKIGIDKVYLRIEETPELKSILDVHPRRMDIHAEFVNHIDKTNNWHTLQTRQGEFCTKIINKLQGCNAWIFQNIDDDELIYSSHGNIHQSLNKVPFYKESIFIPTIEAVYPKISDTCFNTHKFVKCDSRALCTSYYGGKSCGRVSATLSPFGPHQFRGLLWKGNESLCCYKADDVYILHHESCNFQKWKTKYEALSIGDKKIPDGFSFYNDSIRVIKTGDLNQMRAFYKKHKVDPYYSKNTITIQI